MPHLLMRLADDGDEYDFDEKVSGESRRVKLAPGNAVGMYDDAGVFVLSLCCTFSAPLVVLCQIFILF